MPACPRCGGANPSLLYVPGDASGPSDTSRIYAHWRCDACGKLNYLPQSRWVPASGAAPPAETTAHG